MKKLLAFLVLVLVGLVSVIVLISGCGTANTSSEGGGGGGETSVTWANTISAIVTSNCNTGGTCHKGNQTELTQANLRDTYGTTKITAKLDNGMGGLTGTQTTSFKSWMSGGFN